MCRTVNAKKIKLETEKKIVQKINGTDIAGYMGIT